MLAVNACNYAIMQVCKFASTQVRNYANTQLRKYPSTQVHSAHVRKYASKQVCTKIGPTDFCYTLISFDIKCLLMSNDAATIKYSLG